MARVALLVDRGADEWPVRQVLAFETGRGQAIRKFAESRFYTQRFG